MSTLGNQTTGTSFSISGSFGDVAGGWWQVPSPGIYVNQISAFYGNNGTASNTRLYVWGDSGGAHPSVWLVRGSSTISTPGSVGWVRQSSFAYNTGSGFITADGYLPSTYKIWIGYYVSSGISAFQGAGSGKTELGNTADTDWNDHGQAAGVGYIAAYIDYTPLAAPTITSISPSVAPPGATVTLTGTAYNHASSVTIGGVSASYTVVSDTSITATVPSGIGGVVTVTVTNPAGTGSSTMTAGQIYYGTGSAVASIANVWYGTGSGVAKVAGIWVPNGAGVKRVW